MCIQQQTFTCFLFWTAASGVVATHWNHNFNRGPVCSATRCCCKQKKTTKIREMQKPLSCGVCCGLGSLVDKKAACMWQHDVAKHTNHALSDHFGVPVFAKLDAWMHDFENNNSSKRSQHSCVDCLDPQAVTGPKTWHISAVLAKWCSCSFHGRHTPSLLHAPLFLFVLPHCL